ncbi:MAG: methyltransferase, partial [Actinomycetota bacterium]
LEPIAAAEIDTVGAVTKVGHREVHFESDDLSAAARLGSVDDVFVSCARITGIGHTRESLRGLAERTRRLDVGAVAVRLGRRVATFDVSASFLGARNYNRFEIEDAIGGAISATTGWQYVRRAEEASSGDLTVRAHLREDEALIGVRIGERPLHRRPYKLESPKGSLHPPVAFAMAMLAGLRPKERVLDPFCGAGTIAIEAARTQRLEALASDLDPDAVGMTVRNAARAGVDVRAFVADAARPPLAHADRIITNLPWGHGVATRGRLGEDPARWWDEVREVGPVIVALTASPPRGEVSARIPISLFGRHPEIVVVGGAIPEPISRRLAG